MPRSPGERPEPVVEGPLLQALRAREAPDRFLPFQRFMEVALYGPGVGYYHRPRSPLGPSGDFYTAPRVHPLFARTVADRVAEVRDAVAGQGPFAVVDLGAGDGTLLAGVLRALGERGRAAGLEAVAIDRAPARRAASAEAAGAAAASFGIPVRQAGSLSEVGPLRGVVLAHELLDAQPVRRLRWDGSAWRELGYRLDAGRLLPAERPVPGTVPGRPLPALGPEDAGTVVEVAPAAEAIVREVADHLERGLLVVVDFGAEEGELLAGHPTGTVAAVRAHRPLASPTEEVGRADLSAFVNFTRLRQAAAAAGLVEVAYRSQAEALGAWGFPAELDRALAAAGSAEEEVRVRLAAKNLLFGFSTFRALELAAPTDAGRLGGLSGASRPAPP